MISSLCHFNNIFENIKYECKEIKRLICLKYNIFPEFPGGETLKNRCLVSVWVSSITVTMYFSTTLLVRQGEY